MSEPVQPTSNQRPNLADYIAKWSRKYLAPSQQELSAREEYAIDLAHWQEKEIKRLCGALSELKGCSCLCPTCFHAIERALSGDSSTPETSGDLTDTDRINFLEAWVQNSRERGFKWDTFTFNTDSTVPVREQIDQQIVVGMTEILKHRGVAVSSVQETSPSLLAALRKLPPPALPTGEELHADSPGKAEPKS